MFFIFENSRISEVLDFRHVFSPSFLGLLATTKLKREDNINTGGDQKRRRRNEGGNKNNNKNNNKLKDEEYKAPKTLVNLSFIYVAVVAPATFITYIATAAAPVIPRDY